MTQLRTIDMTEYVETGAPPLAQCRGLATDLRDYGAVLVCDPRVNEADNKRYADLLVRYFAQPYAARVPDQRPDLHFQVGVSPPYSEKPFDFRPVIAGMPVAHWPHIPGAGFRGDPKERFFRLLGPRPTQTAFPKLNAELAQVIPAGFASEWAETLDRWGNQMLAALETVCEMLALGCGLPPRTFADRMQGAPHLVAPNGVNLVERGRLGEIWNAWHRDLNALSIHGRSNFPGLRIWPRNGMPCMVEIPRGHLLVQVGQQLEHLSAGYFRAGWHEAVCLPETVQAIARAEAAGSSHIRVSSTVFGHFASDGWLEPMTEFMELYTWEEIQKLCLMYPRMRVGDHMMGILLGLGLAKNE